MYNNIFGVVQYKQTPGSKFIFNQFSNLFYIEIIDKIKSITKVIKNNQIVITIFGSVFLNV